jgi:hypothetical protein
MGAVSAKEYGIIDAILQHRPGSSANSGND